MLNHLTKIKALKKLLEQNRLIHSIHNNSFFYNDEPSFYTYGVELNTDGGLLNKRDYYSYFMHNPVCGGLSFQSKRLALLKSLAETLERLSLYIFPVKSVVYSSFAELVKKGKKALDPFFYTDKKRVKTIPLGWITGFNLVKNHAVLIPAQLVFLQYHHYLSYVRSRQEPILSRLLSTGAASGTNHEDTLLRSIYEVVERDAAMTTYLLKSPVTTIDINSVSSTSVKKIQSYCIDYHLNWLLFDITNDLQIPTYMSILLDRSGVGPAVAVGTKSSLNSSTAIVGSVEEAFMSRFWGRNEMIKQNYTIPRYQYKNITTLSQRALFWSSRDKIKLLKYLTGLPAKRYQPIRSETILSQKKELNKLLGMIVKKGYWVYYVDITLPMFKKINFFAYKAIIPGLQPLYLDEQLQELRPARLKEVARYFHQQRLEINSVPHFYL